MYINFWLQIPVALALLCLTDQRLWYPPCKGVRNNGTKMLECCRIFALSQSTENREYCAMSCLDGDSEFDYSIECCFEDCFADSSGIYRGTKFNYTALLLSVTWNGEVDEETFKIAEQSIETCKSKVKPNDTSPSYCNIPSYVYHFTQCVLTENYMNCPNVTSNSECAAMGSALIKCDKIITTLKPKRTRPTTTKKPVEKRNRTYPTRKTKITTKGASQIATTVKESRQKETTVKGSTTKRNRTSRTKITRKSTTNARK